VEGFDGATIQDPRMIKIGEWFYVTYACRHYPFGQFWIPEVRGRYVKPDCPGSSALPADQRDADGALDDEGLQELIRAGWLTDPMLDDRDVILFPEKVGGKFVMLHRPLEWIARNTVSNTPFVDFLCR